MLNNKYMAFDEQKMKIVIYKKRKPNLKLIGMRRSHFVKK